MTEHKIVFGDSRNMQQVADKSVQLIVTSPPYWQLKDYGTADQIGFNNSYEEYINNLNLVWQECYRVLDNGCRLCINIGDQFARSVYYGRYKVIPIRTEIIRFCEFLGMDYMGAIIWQKATTMNTSGGGAFCSKNLGSLQNHHPSRRDYPKYLKMNGINTFHLIGHLMEYGNMNILRCSLKNFLNDLLKCFLLSVKLYLILLSAAALLLWPQRI